jgi:hypothetical protein
MATSFVFQEAVAAKLYPLQGEANGSPLNLSKVYHFARPSVGNGQTLRSYTSMLGSTNLSDENTGEGQMPWDDELEGLAKYVHESLGEDPFRAVVLRALHRTVDGTPANLSALSDIVAEAGPAEPSGFLTSDDGLIVSLEMFYNALRGELLRVARPQ